MKDPKTVAEKIVEAGFYANNLYMFQHIINKQIDDILDGYKTQNGQGGINNLSMQLEILPKGSRIITEHSALVSEDWRKRREKMQKQDDLIYILKELRGDELESKPLSGRYEVFKVKYEEMITNIFSDSKIDQKLKLLVSQTKFQANKMIKKLDRNKFLTPSIRNDIPELISHIFAVWTLKNSQHYNSTRGIDENRAYLLMPHAGQVIAIFRMFGIGYNSKSEKYNNLIQIGTGEGKSVVMAVAASVFALIGFDVNCSCYSEYLSSRDKQAFASVFEALNRRPHRIWNV